MHGRSERGSHWAVSQHRAVIRSRRVVGEQTIVFDVGTNATQGLHYETLW